MKHLLKVVFASVVLAGLTSQALADQCSWNDRSVAQRVRGYLAYNQEPLYIYCEPCGDTEMKSVVYGHDYENTHDQRAIHFRWQDAAAPQKGETGWQIVLNEGYGDIERSVDLAYVYEKTSFGFVNVGAKFGCRNNSFWNPEGVENFKGAPVGVSPYIEEGVVPVVHDVSTEDFFRAHYQRYPDKPQG